MLCFTLHKDNNVPSTTPHMAFLGVTVCLKFSFVISFFYFIYTYGLVARD